MINGLPRYHKQWNAEKGPNYFIMDRNTGKKVDECDEYAKSDDLVKQWNKKDRKERGLKEIDEIEVSSSYFSGKNREPIEISPMTIYKSTCETT